MRERHQKDVRKKGLVHTCHLLASITSEEVTGPLHTILVRKEEQRKAGEVIKSTFDLASINTSLVAKSRENFFPKEAALVISTAQLITQDSAGSYTD